MNIQDWLRSKQLDQQDSEAHDLPSLDFIFDQVKEEIRAQLARVDVLDTKVSFVMGAATGLVGIALTIQATFLSLHTYLYCKSYLPAVVLHMHPLVKRALPITPLIVTCIGAVTAGYQAYKIKKYESMPVNPEELYTYLEQDLVITKVDVFNSMKIVFKGNEQKIIHKANWLRSAIRWLMLECLVFLLLLLYLSIC
jgi:hypothetical protein